MAGPVKATILFIQPRLHDFMSLDTGKELRNLRDSLLTALRGDTLSWQVLPDARVRDMVWALRYYQPAIVHYAGHGSSYGDLFFDPDGDEKTSVRVAAEDFAEIIRTYQAEATQPVRLMVLAACHTARTAELVAEQVDCVVGMEGEPDDVALASTFTPSFYAALADGRSVANAVDVTRAHLGVEHDQDARMVRVFSKNGRDPSALRVIDMVPQPLGNAHMDYLRRLFGKSWASVSLADMLKDRDDEIKLLDIYVPLKVDFGVTVKTQRHLIVDWWAEQEQSEALKRAMHRAGADDALAAVLEEPQKLRAWPDLGVSETGLQPVVDGIQRKISERRSKGEETKDGEHRWYMEAHDAASVQSRFVLLGDPGSGKSSFLRHLALCMAGELRRRHGDEKTPENAGIETLRDWLLGVYTPVYFELRDLVRNAFPTLPANPDAMPPLPSCDDFWRYVGQHVLSDDLAALSGDLQQLFASGQAVLLLDGLDEVPQGADQRRRRQIKSLIASLVATYPDLRIIITSRPHAYRRGDWALEGFGRAELRPLDLSRLRELSLALFTKVRPERSQQEADEFIDAIGRARVKPSMRANPLFFTMLVGIWLGKSDQSKDLPATEAELYRQSVGLLLGRWTHRRTSDPSVLERLTVDEDQMRAVLETLACTVQGQSAPEQDTTVFNGGLLASLLYEAGVRIFPEDLLDYLSQHAGILVSSAPQEFHFIHRSFQEHLAACELTHDRPADREPPVPLDRRFPQGLVDRTLQRPDLWNNVFELATDELLARDQGSEFWRLLATTCQPLVKDDQYGDAAMLAIQIAGKRHLFQQPLPSVPEFDEAAWLATARQCRPVLQKAAEKILTDHEHFDLEQRDIAGKLLGGDPFPGHDTRDGVGLRDGLPDIEWVEVDPETGRGDWTYQNKKHKPLETFWIAKYPVTYAQFEAFLRAEDGFRIERWWEGLTFPDGHQGVPGEQRFKYWNHPRETVSWYDAMAFCRWLTAKAKERPDLLPPGPGRSRDGKITLPTEQQWEKAARGHNGRQYPWGNEYEEGRANIDEVNSKVGAHYLQKTNAVGMYPHEKPDDSPYGLADLSGNVWEWCLNEYNNPERVQEEGSETRVLRGGSWSNSHGGAAASSRGRGLPDLRDSHGGFRVVLVGFVPV